MRVPALFTFLCCSLSSFCQRGTGSLQGHLLLADGTPATGMTIELAASKKIAVTDRDGFFVFRRLPALQDTLQASSIETNFYRQAVQVAAGAKVDLGTIRLSNNVTQLQHVEIKGRELHSYKSDYSFFGEKTQMAQKDIPQSISTVTKELIQDKMEFTLKDAMDEVAGVNQYSGFDEYTIRGFRAENSRDINGLRGYNTTYTSSMLVNIERVEVIKGPTATLYGNCDPGGTINLVTKKPLEKNEAELNIYQGSWDHWRGQADITGPLNKSKTLLYRFNAGYDNTQSFRNQTFSRSYELAPSFTFIPNDRLQINFDFSLSHMSTVLDYGQPGFENDLTLKSTPISLSLSQPGDYLHETDIAAILTVNYRLNKHLTFSSGWLNYQTRQDVGNHGFNGFITPDSINLYYTSWTYPTVTNTVSNYLTWQFNTGHAAHQMIFGYDYIRSTVNLNQNYYELPNQFGQGNGIVGTFSLKNPQYYKRPVSTYQLSGFDSDGTDVDDNIYHTNGVYVQDQVRLNRWKLLFSLREEFYKGDDVGDSSQDLAETVFLPRVGLTYAIRPNLSAYVTYNKGFDAFEAATSAQIFNSPFKPQTSVLYEAGLKGTYLNDRMSASIALYRLTLLNVAVSANDPTNPNLYVQQGQNQSQGVELETAGKLLPNLSVTLSYANDLAKVTVSKVAEQVGARVENAPRNSSGSWIKYTINKGWLKGFGIAAGHSQVGYRTTLDPTINLPGYVVVNAGIHYDRKHIMLAMNLNNITNETYWSGAYNNINKWPGAPRNYMVRLGYRF